MNGMCKHTHFLKTADNFTVTNEADGSMTWTTPAGNSYTKPPDDLRITDYGVTPEVPPMRRDQDAVKPPWKDSGPLPDTS